MNTEPLTHRDLDYLLETYRKGAMLDGTDEHTDFVVAAVEYLPRLVAAVRPTIPGELHLSVFIAGFVPCGTLNSREHWSIRKNRVANEKLIVKMKLRPHSPPSLPVKVTITRCAPRMLDSDNCVGAQKATRDFLAEWFGVDDRDERITWCVKQRKVPKKEAGTEIRIEARL